MLNLTSHLRAYANVTVDVYTTSFNNVSKYDVHL